MKKILLLAFAILLIAWCWNKQIQVVDNPDKQTVEKAETQTEQTYKPRGLVGSTGISLEGRGRTGLSEDEAREIQEAREKECTEWKCIKNTTTFDDLKVLCNHNAFCWK